MPYGVVKATGSDVKNHSVGKCMHGMHVTNQILDLGMVATKYLSKNLTNKVIVNPWHILNTTPSLCKVGKVTVHVALNTHVSIDSYCSPITDTAYTLE